jgi:acyl carrier protein
MDREQVAAVVIKHLVDVVGDLKVSDIDMSRSMKDFGANSLDMVEVVSCAMRELKVKVPRSELSKLTNMNGLVDLLYTSLQEKTKTAVVS